MLAVVIVSAVVLPYVHFAVVENQCLMGITRSADAHLAMGVLRFPTIVLLAHLVNIPRAVMAGSREVAGSRERQQEHDSSRT